MTEANELAQKLLGDAARMVVTSVSEVVPAEAQVHLLNAQRELLLAVAAVIEHNVHRSMRHPRAVPAKKRSATRKRPTKITVE